MHPPPPMPTAPRPSRTMDITVTAVLSAVLLALSAGVMFLAVPFAFASAYCETGCKPDVATGAMFTVLGAPVLVVGVVLVGVILSAVSRKPMFAWPLIGAVVLVVIAVVAAYVLDWASGN